MRRYVVRWEVIHPMFGEVEAISKADAIGKMRRGEFIEGTIDSEPGDNIWTRAYAIEIKEEIKP